jgi:nucleoside-triphosphatase THEP1
VVRHVFLTGQKQCGKTTLLKKALARYPGTVGGFFTRRTNAFLKDRYSVHLFLPGEDAAPGRDNLLFVCGSADGKTAERFDRLGCEALSRSAGKDLIVMDELGPHEAEAALFRAAVLKRLDGDIPILGVLQSPAEAFWPEVAAHPRATLLEVTEANRNDERLLRQLLLALGAR